MCPLLPDAYTKSIQASAAESSFYGDNEVQLLSTVGSGVASGTFTVAYGTFSLQLPGTVSGYSLDTVFSTTADLSPYLQPGTYTTITTRHHDLSFAPSNLHILRHSHIYPLIYIVPRTYL